MIRLESLQKQYGKLMAVDGVSLHVPEGELFAYLGPNGAGKSTTIKILTGLTRLSGGTACLGGADIEKDPIAAKRQCGVVMQQINMDSDLTVLQNLQIHGQLFRMPKALRQERIETLLDYVGLLDRMGSEVGTLSGGMKRRLMIARALMHQPKILFLDEPTVGLDAEIRRKIWGLIKRIQKDGATVFLTTHYIEEAEFLADRVAFLDEGRIRAIDTPLALMKRVGAWAYDCLSEDGMRTEYFATREEAKQAIQEDGQGQTLRRVNLEDAFLQFTGKAVS